MKGEFRKVDDKTLVAIGTEAMEALAAVHRGANCMADVRAARNVEQFNLFWALMGLVAEATDTTKEAVKEWAMKKLGYVDMLWLPDGSIEIKAKSVSWEKMEQARFAEFFQAVIPRIAELLDAAPQDLIDRFNDMLDPDGRRHFKKILKHMPSPPVQPEEADTESVQ
jgi:hypothetical protein